MKPINLFEKIVGSGLYTGYIPIASGTFGSIVGVLIYLIPGFENPYVIIPSIIILFVYGIYVSGKFEKQFGKDPSQCTVDEIVGTWVSFILLPKKLLVIMFAFLLWRLLDIIKPFPARNSEKINGGLGIMLDDVISGFYTVIIIHLTVYFGVL
ncbi:MAG TPA: phosphatidylglycerophosphatase A [Ignavibacteriaceae bacterium]|jgi:phosphatidylglycerophosphatase A|nr:MAG: phosphatidylglycerophosphatase A [Ignavibacteriales bacterium UTCHB2]HQF44019.1 phosphatidylglycerophosphatase A [Ignavibacteriaceae bacterium]HQI41720.1 phosphatidylglycerophosphatase A [Ignavibacteriaceae bacterium]